MDGWDNMTCFENYWCTYRDKYVPWFQREGFSDLHNVKIKIRSEIINDEVLIFRLEQSIIIVSRRFNSV